MRSEYMTERLCEQRMPTIGVVSEHKRGKLTLTTQ